MRSARIAGFLGFLLWAPVSIALAQVTKAPVTGGRVQGVVVDGVAAFKGIPFAAPPVGALRWKAPQPVQPWRGVRQVDAYAPPCVQPPDALQAFHIKAAPGEDCLYLNVWTGARRASEKRPVMVWFYGGAFRMGVTGAPNTDGTALAQRGVVLVSVAYRLGPLGFLAHPELTREDGRTSGNYGLQDMIAGLAWVRANIRRFGGDPGNVTIFGESSGGDAVSMLAASPPAKGLFQRVISESGMITRFERTGGRICRGHATLKLAEEEGAKLLAGLGATDLAAARALPAEKILAAATGTCIYYPVFDAAVLPGDAYLIYSAGQFNDTPILVGSNSDEGATFSPGQATPESFEQLVRRGYGSWAEDILAAYPHADAAQATQAARNLTRESSVGWPVWDWATQQSRQGRHAAYVYYFDHPTPDSPGGAQHSAEIPFVFGVGDFQAIGRAPGPPTAAESALSKLMQQYWINFAKKGDPNGPGLPAWPAFEQHAPQAMIFREEKSAAGSLPNLQQILAVDPSQRYSREHPPK